jgi:hypothetical protein
VMVLAFNYTLFPFLEVYTTVSTQIQQIFTSSTHLIVVPATISNMR